MGKECVSAVYEIPFEIRNNRLARTLVYLTLTDFCNTPDNSKETTSLTVPFMSTEDAYYNKYSWY